DLPRAGRRRTAHLGLRSTALPGRCVHRRAVVGGLLRRRCPPSPTRAGGAGGGRRRGGAPRRRPRARQPRAAELPRRQRALGAGAVRAEDLRRPLRDQDARPLAGALVSGKLGDSVGRARVMRAALVVYGLGLMIPFASTVPWVVALAAPLVAF